MAKAKAAKEPEHSNWVKRHPVMSTVGAAAGADQFAKHRRLIKHQYDWHRSNGEVVRIKGYDKKGVKKVVSPVLGTLDKHLKSDTKLAPLEIRRQRSMGGLLAGSYRSGSRIDEALGRKPRPQVRVGVTLKGTRARATLAHELGHAADYRKGGKNFHTVLNHEEHSKSTGGHWTAKDYKSAPMKGKGVTKASKGAGSPPSGSFQARHPVEDMAESFREHMKFPHDAKHGSPTNLTEGRIKYLDKHFTKGSPSQKAMQGYAAKIKKVPGLHNHFDKFAVGGAALAAAGYGVHKTIHHNKRTK